MDNFIGSILYAFGVIAYAKIGMYHYPEYGFFIFITCLFWPMALMGMLMIWLFTKFVLTSLFILSIFGY